MELTGPVPLCADTLRFIDAFVPRITFGKVAQRPGVPAPRKEDGSTSREEDEGRAGASATTSDARLSEAENERGETDSGRQQELGRGPQDNDQVRGAAQAFAHVKRDLVRLLGILASQDRTVQDRVRECGGIPVVMNLCVVDDYNPCECWVSVLIF